MTTPSAADTDREIVAEAAAKAAGYVTLTDYGRDKYYRIADAVLAALAASWREECLRARAERDALRAERDALQYWVDTVALPGATTAKLATAQAEAVTLRNRIVNALACLPGNTNHAIDVLEGRCGECDTHTAPGGGKA